jgi:hypothetical protein
VILEYHLTLLKQAQGLALPSTIEPGLLNKAVAFRPTASANDAVCKCTEFPDQLPAMASDANVLWQGTALPPRQCATAGKCVFAHCAAMFIILPLAAIPAIFDEILCHDKP